MFARITASWRKGGRCHPLNPESFLTGTALILLRCQHDLKLMHKYTERRGEKATSKSVANSDISRVHQAHNRAVPKRPHPGAIHLRKMLTSDVSAHSWLAATPHLISARLCFGALWTGMCPLGPLIPSRCADLTDGTTHNRRQSCGRCRCELTKSIRAEEVRRCENAPKILRTEASVPDI